MDKTGCPFSSRLCIFCQYNLNRERFDFTNCVYSTVDSEKYLNENRYKPPIIKYGEYIYIGEEETEFIEKKAVYKPWEYNFLLEKYIVENYSE